MAFRPFNKLLERGLFMKQHAYLALDFPTWQEAKRFLEEHQLKGVPVKVGMELFYREGPTVIENLKENNHPVFLDLKLHDIPTTVKRAMKNIARLQVDVVNVHALGGGKMIEYAKEGLLAGGVDQTKLLAVTVLTSHDQETINNELRIEGDLKQNVKHLADMSRKHGADGVVCSVNEVKLIKQTCGQAFLTVTPGIRLENTSVGDQKRIATPRLARESGADQIVIGRSVTQAKDPKKAYEQVIKEWDN